jgi:hypothetical protein
MTFSPIDDAPDRIQQLAQLAQRQSTSIEALIQQLHLVPMNHG